MMYKEFRSLHKVKGTMCFKQIEDKFIYCDNESNLVCLNDKEFLIIWQKHYEGIVQVNNNLKDSFLIVINEGFNENTYLIDFQGSLMNDYSFKIYPIESEILSFITIAIKDEIGIFNKIENRILWVLKDSFGGSLWGNTDYIIYKKFDDRTVIINRKTQTGETLWQFFVSEIGKYKDFDAYFNPIEKEGEVRKIIGVCGNILLVVISGGFEGKNNVSSQLIGLSCQSGELLWRLDMFDANGIRTHYGSYETLQIEGINNRLLGFNSQGFIEIDIKNGKVKRFNDLIYSEINDKADLYVRGLEFFYKDKILKNVYSETLVGEHLYFKATNTANRRHSLSSNVIGAYNYKIETIDWLYEFEDLAPSVSIKESPKVEGNRLYALDSSGTLHIFERDLS